MADKIKYLTDGAETYGADPETGFDNLTTSASNLTPLREDDNGDTYVGDPWAPSQGFLSRPKGWER